MSTKDIVSVLAGHWRISEEGGGIERELALAMGRCDENHSGNVQPRHEVNGIDYFPHRL